MEKGQSKDVCKRKLFYGNLIKVTSYEKIMAKSFSTISSRLSMPISDRVEREKVLITLYILHGLYRG